MKSNTKFFLALAVLVLAFAFAGDASAAGDAGDAAKRVFGQFKDFADLVTAGAFLGGIVVGVTALFKFKAYSDNPQQNKITTPIILAIVAAGLIGLPAFLAMSKNSVLQGQNGSMEEGVYRNIGN